MDWRWTGMFTMMCKAAPFDKLACMIDADIVATRHVSGSFQLGRIFHEMITCIMVVDCVVGAAHCHQDAVVCVECQEPSLFE